MSPTNLSTAYQTEGIRPGDALSGFLAPIRPKRGTMGPCYSIHPRVLGWEFLRWSAGGDLNPRSTALQAAPLGRSGTGAWYTGWDSNPRSPPCEGGAFAAWRYPCMSSVFPVSARGNSGNTLCGSPGTRTQPYGFSDRRADPTGHLRTLERPGGLEPPPPPWQGGVQPGTP